MSIDTRHLALILFFALMFATTSAAQSVPMNRQGSGTSWLPDNAPMRAIHTDLNGWAVMMHFNAFAQYLRDAEPRGSSQFGSVNWFMVEARRSTSAGSFTARAMISAEPFTIRGCGYPDLLATGESCEGAAIHDRQHPHDLFMELAVEYERAIGPVHLQLYGGPAGEPALGPVAFVHRPSAATNPLAPITHHWFDSTHLTYGVAAAAVRGYRWKIESSIFNGREPDEHRTGIDLAAMDSWSARAWWLPSSRWALQVSTGLLKEAELDHDDRIDVRRTTASAMYQRSLRSNLTWATTVAWGRNTEGESDGSNAWLVETAIARSDRSTIYARGEVVDKSAHDLALSGDAIFTVAKLQAGYTRSVSRFKFVTASVGGSASFSVLPASLSTIYGARAVPGVVFYMSFAPPSS